MAHALSSGGGTGNYTVTQLDTILRSGAASCGCRFDVLDQSMSYLGQLSYVSSATVDMDPTRLIPGSLTLSMLPDPLLPIATTVPFTRLIRPWFRVRMPDGGVAEWPMGVYVWTKPTETFQGVNGITTWDVQLGDQTHLLVLGGPGLEGFAVPSTQAITTAINTILQLALPYSPSLAGIVQSGAVTAGPLSWNLLTSQQPQPKPSGGIGDMIVGGSGAPATSWASILQVLHSSLGYMPGYFDWLGVYQAQPMPLNLFSATAEVTLTANSTGILESGITSTPNLANLANWVMVVANNANANAIQSYAIADADTLLPGHPYSHAKTGEYYRVIVMDGTAGDQQTLQARATSELYIRLAGATDISLNTHAWPVIEPWDLVSFQLPTDPTYDTARNLLSKGWSMDLFTGKMSHRLSRITGT